MKKTSKKGFFIGIIIILLISIDLFSKYIFYNKNFLSNLEVFHSSCNTGVSFSIPIPISIIIIISVIATGLFIYFYTKKKIPGRIFVLLIAGTVGNLVDRISLNCVRDFIVFGPLFIFNLADVFLNIGVIGLLRKEFFGEKKL